MVVLPSHVCTWLTVPSAAAITATPCSALMSIPVCFVASYPCDAVPYPGTGHRKSPFRSFSVTSYPGTCSGFGVGVASGSGVGVASGFGVGVASGSGVGVASGSGVGVASGSGVGVTSGSGVGVTSGSGVGVTSGSGVGVTSSSGVDVTVRVDELLSLSVTSSARAVIGRVVRIIITDRIHAIGFLNLFILSQILS